MHRLSALMSCLLLLHTQGFGQSMSFTTYMNPVIPGDHPDCTVTRVGKDFYTTGSSFNPTPVMYHSTDLVHWEACAQPVSAAWANYGNSPSGGCWGGQMVNHANKYWHFFSRANTMYFVTADDPKAEWSLPTAMNCPASVPRPGYDNSIPVGELRSEQLPGTFALEQNYPNPFNPVTTIGFRVSGHRTRPQIPGIRNPAPVW